MVGASRAGRGTGPPARRGRGGERSGRGCARACVRECAWMTRAVVSTGIVLALLGHPHAKAPPARASARTPPHAPARPPEPLPMLPSVARVRVEAACDRLLVMEDVNLPRGDWVSGGLDLYVAFGAPGVPIAMDAQIGVVIPGTGEGALGEPADS